MEQTNRILVLGGALLSGLLGALMLGQAVANNDYTRIALILMTVFATLAVLMMGNRYWYVIPVVIGLDLPTFQLGGRNINIAELAVFGCTLVFASRFALKKENLDLVRLRNVPIYLYFLWVMITWAFHPVGLAGLGSEIGGGRFYATVLLALAAFLIVSNQRISEEDIKWIFILLFVGSVATMVVSLIEYAVLGRKLGVVQETLDIEGEYTWHQTMSGPASLAAMVLLARYRPSKVFTFLPPWKLLAYFICFIPILMSGKRSAAGAFLLYPVFAAILRREYRYIWIFGTAAFLLITIIVTGQGNFFHLPFNAQRALSWLPANWDPQVAVYRGGNDEFRRALRELAWEEIQKDPWWADGFRVDIQETAAHYYQMLLFGDRGEIRNQVLPFALGKAWHNVWLGYAADFGIPLSIIQVFVFLTGLYMAYQATRLTPYGTWIHTMSFYLLLFIIGDILTSWTSGHSAYDTFSRWWRYGLIFAIVSQAQNRKVRQPHPKEKPLKGVLQSQGPRPYVAAT